MSTKANILKILNRRKTSVTSFQLYDRIVDVAPKTVRNTLGILIQDGLVARESNHREHNGRPVLGYLSA